jgi:hypothetical protein
VIKAHSQRRDGGAANSPPVRDSATAPRQRWVVSESPTRRARSSDSIANGPPLSPRDPAPAGRSHLRGRPRRRTLGSGEFRAELTQPVATQCTAQPWKQFFLFLPHVVTNALHEDRNLGVVALTGWVHDLQLGQRQLHEMVLFEGFQHAVAGRGNGIPGGRIQDVFLDDRVSRQRLDHALDEPLALLPCALAGVLELVEEFLHLAMISRQQLEGMDLVLTGGCPSGARGPIGRNPTCSQPASCSVRRWSRSGRAWLSLPWQLATRRTRSAAACHRVPCVGQAELGPGRTRWGRLYLNRGIFG